MLYRQADRGHNRDDGPHPDGAVLRWVHEVPGSAYTIKLNDIYTTIGGLFVTNSRGDIVGKLVEIGGDE